MTEPQIPGAACPGCSSGTDPPEVGSARLRRSRIPLYCGRDVADYTVGLARRDLATTLMRERLMRLMWVVDSLFQGG